MKYQPYLFKELDYLLSRPAFVVLYHKYKTTAKHNKRAFKLTKEQFKKLTSSKCFYCGTHPYLLFNPLRSTNRKGTPISREAYLYNGVDRVNSKKGYIISNCVSCCFICNRMKNTIDLDVFQKQIKKIYHYQNFKISF